MLGERWPERVQQSQRGAGGEAEHGGNPVERFYNGLAFPCSFLAEDAVGDEGVVEAEDGYERENKDRPVNGHDQRRKADGRHAPEIDLRPRAGGPFLLWR